MGRAQSLVEAHMSKTNSTDLIITVTGPTCSGKSTIVQHLQKEFKLFGECRSTTTRNPRHGEQHGREYDFVTKEQFQALRDQHAFLEDVTFVDNFYGLTMANLREVQDAGKIPIVVVEPRGAEQISFVSKHSNITHYAVYIETPLRVLIERYLGTRSDGSDTTYAAKRLEGLFWEFLKWPEAMEQALVRADLTCSIDGTKPIAESANIIFDHLLKFQRRHPVVVKAFETLGAT